MDLTTLGSGLHTPPMSNLQTFLTRIFALALLVTLAILALIVVQQIWHPLDPFINFINQDLDVAGSTLKSEVVGGITLGALAVFVILLLIPILTPGVNTKAFLTAFFRGILASSVYLATDFFYGKMENLGRFYLLAAMAGAIIVTFILVEIIVLSGRRMEQKSLRTDIMASIASGMAFSLIVKLTSFGWESFHRLWG